MENAATGAMAVQYRVTGVRGVYDMSSTGVVKNIEFGWYTIKSGFCMAEKG